MTPEERAIREALGKLGTLKVTSMRGDRGRAYGICTTAEQADYVAAPSEVNDEAEMAAIVAAVNGLPPILTALDTARAGEARLREAAGDGTAWAAPEVLVRLAAAARHLLRDHDCDAHGYEGVDAAATSAETIAPVLRSALQASPSTWLTERDRATRAAALRELPVLRTCGDCGHWHPGYGDRASDVAHWPRDPFCMRAKREWDDKTVDPKAPPPAWCPLRLIASLEEARVYLRRARREP